MTREPRGRRNAPISVMEMTSPVRNGKSSACVPSKSYSAVAVPRPAGAAGTGLEAAGATGAWFLAAAGAGAGAAACGDPSKRPANCGRELKYSSRSWKKASFSCSSVSMAVKTPPVAAADGVEFRAGVAGGPCAEPVLIGGGGGRELGLDEEDEYGAPTGGASPGEVALLPVLGRFPPDPMGTALSILSNMGVMEARPFSAYPLAVRACACVRAESQSAGRMTQHKLRRTCRECRLGGSAARQPRGQRSVSRLRVCPRTTCPSREAV